MEFKDIIKILILFIIFVCFVIWLVYYLYSIKLENRLKNTTISLNNDDKTSIFDSLFLWYEKEKQKIGNKLITNLDNEYQKQKAISTFVDSIACSLLLIFIYLFLGLFYLFIPKISVIVLLLIIGLLIPNAISVIREEKHKRNVERNLLKIITLINNGISSGKTIREAVESTVDKFDDDIKYELEEVTNDLEHGLSLEVAFRRFERRTSVNDVIYLTTTLSLLSKTGGNILLMFNYLEKIFKTRNKLKQELSTTIASSKLVFLLMTILPLVVFGGMILLYENYLILFFSSVFGNLLLIIILLLYILYVVVVKKMMEIDEY